MNPNPHFSPPALAKPVDPVVRFGLEMDYCTLVVVLCGGLPTLLARLCFRENVRVHTVADAYELQGLLEDENGLPADLIVIKNYELQGLPPMTLQSPVDGHEATVLFRPDLAVEDEEGFGALCRLMDRLLLQKQQFVRDFCTFSKEEIAL